MSTVAMLLEFPCRCTKKSSSNNLHYIQTKISKQRTVDVLQSSKELVLCFIIITVSFWPLPSSPVVCFPVSGQSSAHSSRSGQTTVCTSKHILFLYLTKKRKKNKTQISALFNFATIFELLWNKINMSAVN